MREAGAIEAKRRTFADLASETPLDGAAARALGHDDETIGERRLA
jgi:hypothetical protein